MVTALLQTLLCVGAGFLLWRLWRTFRNEDRWTRGVVFTGFILRAAGGLLLFWVMYLDLPLWRSLRMDDGYWFFAQDAKTYLIHVERAVDGGLQGTLLYPRTAPSVTFVQALSIFAMLFGAGGAVGLLMNLFCYLGSCVVIARWKNATPAGRIPAAIAISAISLLPSAILWSLQPLKDTLFAFLIVCFVAACALWQRAWQSLANSKARQLLVAAVVMVATVFALAGIRWYAALAIVIATGVFFLFNIFNTPRKAAALVAGVVMQFLVMQALAVSAWPYLPEGMYRAFVPWAETKDKPIVSPTALAQQVESAREGFERTGGATKIGLGPVFQADQPQPEPTKTEPVRVAARGTTAPPDGTTAAPTTTEPPSAESTPQISASPAPAATVTAAPTTTEPPSAESTPQISASPAPAATVTAAHPPQVAQNVPAEPAPEPRARPAITAETTKAAPSAAGAPAQPPSTATAAAAVARAEEAVSSAPTGRENTAPAKSTAQASGEAGSESRPPESRWARLVAGACAVLLPSSIARGAGLLDMRGGRGFWWFTDIDTIVFDIVLVIALVSVVRRGRWALLHNPMFWLVLTLASIGIPLLYVVTNYGTLFRLRIVIYVAGALMPLALAMTTPADRRARRASTVGNAEPDTDTRLAANYERERALVSKTSS